jgi:hypothetical protein
MEKKLLTYLNSALNVLSGLGIFPRGTNKKLNFVDQCYYLSAATMVARTSLDVKAATHAPF